MKTLVVLMLLAGGSPQPLPAEVPTCCPQTCEQFCEAQAQAPQTTMPSFRAAVTKTPPPKRMRVTGKSVIRNTSGKAMRSKAITPSLAPLVTPKRVISPAPVIPVVQPDAPPGAPAMGQCKDLLTGTWVFCRAERCTQCGT